MSKEIIHKIFSFDIEETKEIEKANQKYGIVKGYASTYDNVDRGGDRIAPGAFTNSINRHKASKSRPVRMLFQHNRDSLIGGFPVDKISDDDKGLFVTGEINLDTQKGKEAYSLAKQGVLSDMSIGFSVNKYEIDEDAGTMTFKEIELWEISLVSEPMNPEAQIMEVKAALHLKELPKDFEFPNIETIGDVENCLKDCGFSGTQRKILISKIKEFTQDEREARGGNKDQMEKDGCDVHYNSINETLVEMQTNDTLNTIIKNLNKFGDE